MRAWIESVRKMEQREPHSYPNLEAAVARMKEANPHLSDEVARHLTVHGTNWNADGSLSWKFDNYVRCLAPYGHNMDDQRAIYAEIACPVLLVWGRESWMPDPDTEDRASAIRNHQRAEGGRRRALGASRSAGSVPGRIQALPAGAVALEADDSLRKKFSLGLSVFTVVPFCRITERTGYSRLVGPAEFAAVRHAHLGMFCGFLEMAARHSRPLDRA